jgi:hypothetical protein
MRNENRSALRALRIAMPTAWLKDRQTFGLTQGALRLKQKLKTPKKERGLGNGKISTKSQAPNSK